MKLSSLLSDININITILFLNQTNSSMDFFKIKLLNYVKFCELGYFKSFVGVYESALNCNISTIIQFNRNKYHLNQCTFVD